MTTESMVLGLNIFAKCFVFVGMTGCELLSVVGADRELDPASYVGTFDEFRVRFTLIVAVCDWFQDSSVQRMSVWLVVISQRY